MPDIARHLFPKAKRQRRERQLADVAVLLPAPAPVAAGLLGSDVSLFHKRDREPALGEEIGCANADNAAADHHGVDSFGQLVVAADAKNEWGHEFALYVVADARGRVIALDESEFGHPTRT